jgi:hypothetical protein
MAWDSSGFGALADIRDVLWPLGDQDPCIIVVFSYNQQRLEKCNPVKPLT